MITIQKAKIEDVSEIKKLLFKTWVATYSTQYSLKDIEKITSEWHSPQRLTEQIQDLSTIFYIAKDENRIVGMCNATLMLGGVSINIQRLHVLPEYQRKGIGSTLMNTIIERCPKALKIILEVEKQNQRALAFYKKFGFKEVDKKVFKIGTISLPCIVMEKVI